MGVRVQSDRQGKTQAQRAVLELRHMVLAGEIAAGGRLFEVELSEHLGISRTPLREALGMLEYEGLLLRRSGGGYEVREFTFDDVTDAIELRGIIEGMIARVSAERGVAPAKLDVMRETVAALDTVVGTDANDVNFARYSELNTQFHLALADMAQSSVLRRELEHVTRLPFAAPGDFLNIQSQDPRFLRSLFISQAQHRAVLEAIELGEGARAEAIMREHARGARDNLEHVVRTDRSQLRNIPGLTLVDDKSLLGVKP